MTEPEAADRQKEILAVGQQLEGEIEKIEGRINTLEESLTQVLRSEGRNDAVSEREKLATPLGDRLYALAMCLREKNSQLSSILDRLEI